MEGGAEAHPTVVVGNSLGVDFSKFPDKNYVANLADRLEGAKKNRNTSIEWSFGIVGVLLAAAVAAPNQATLLPWLLTLTAIALVVQLTALSTASHTACRGLSVISAHLAYLQFSALLPSNTSITVPQFRRHTIRLIVQVDFLGARVQTGLSLFRDVLLLGPGYLFFAALGLNLYISYLHLGSFTQSTYAWWLLAILLPLVLTIVIAAATYGPRTLNPHEAELKSLKNCPVCLHQNPDKLHPDADFLKDVDAIDRTLSGLVADDSH
jgi:hypothetical protein